MTQQNLPTDKDSTLITNQNIFYFLGKQLELANGLIVFEALYDTKCPYFFKDHILYGEIVVPGANHIALVMCAIQKHFCVKSFSLEEATFHKALVLSPEVARIVRVTLKHQDGDIYTYEVHSRKQTHESWVLHATGEVSLQSLSKQTVFLPNKDHFTHSMQQAEFYKSFAENGYQLKATFQWVHAVYWNEGEILAEIRAPKEVIDADQFVLFPSLIDSFYQSTTVGFPHGGLRKYTTSGAIYVPWTNLHIEFYGRQSLTQNYWCHIQIKNTLTDFNDKQEIFKGDLIVCDEQNNMVLKINDWVMKRVTSEQLLSALEK